MVRLLVITYTTFNSRYPGGGWVDSFIRAASSAGTYVLGIVYVSDKKEDPWEREGVKYYPIYAPTTKIEKLASILFHKPNTVKNKLAINRIIADFRPDLIHLFGMETMIGGLVSHVKDIPVVVHLQGILSECVKKWFPREIDRHSLAKYTPLRKRLHRHTTLDFYIEACNRAKNEQLLFEKYCYYLGRTKWDEECCKKYAPGARYFHCDELIRKEFKSCQWRPSDGAIRIATICNGEIYKGYDNILRTAQVLSEEAIDFEWNVYGIESDNMMIRLFEGELGDYFSRNHVHFRGRAQAGALALELARSTVYVHPSHIDNSPNSVCEAMMVGVPVIAMNVGGVSSIIEDGVTGFLVNDYDHEALAQRIISISSNRELSERISNNAREVALKRHSAENVIEQYKNAVSNII